MKIIDDEGCYWTENEHMGFWSNFEPLSCDRRNFIIIKAFVLYLSMKSCGLKVRLIREEKQG